jgi:hypothetical protein
MDKKLQELLESQVLNNDTKEQLVEAFNQKVAEATKSIEANVRKEFASRYDHDKSKLVESMDAFLTESLTKELSELRNDRTEAKKQLDEHKKSLNEFAMDKLRVEIKALRENQAATEKERLKLAKQLIESKKSSKEAINTQLKVISETVDQRLKSEIKELMIDKKALNEAKQETAKKLRESREAYKKQFVNRINVLETKVMEKLKSEISEFEHDKRKLAEERVKLHSEAKKQLDETKKQFIAKAAKLVESKTDHAIKTEFSQLKADLAKARENSFGRRIFEAFATEYMSSYLSEGSEVKKLQKQLIEMTSKLEDNNKLLTEKESEVVKAKQKVLIAEDKAVRTKSLNDLLAPLPREQKRIMTSLLEGVKTERLAESFNRYLPTVMGDAPKKTLVEAPVVKQGSKVALSATVATGDRKNRLSESIEAESKVGSGEILELRKLAGIE